MTGRLGWLDFGKAAGILIVLMVHAGCSLGYVTYYGGMFYMPIFFVAAGYTYRCKKEESFGRFVQKKARRLLLPYFGTSAFLWLFFWVKDSLLTGNPGDLKVWSIFGICYSRNQMRGISYSGENPVLMDLLNAPLWFLTALFLVYVWYELISRSKKKYLWLILGLAAAIGWHYGMDLLLPWSLDAVPYFTVFFAAGEWLREKKVLESIRRSAWKCLVLLLIFLATARLNGSVNLSIGNYGKSMLIYLVVGALGSLLIFLIGSWLEQLCRPLSNLFGCIGRQTLLILCFHMFLFMFLRTGAGILGLGEGWTELLLVVGSAAALTAAGELWQFYKKKRAS
jgi:fucose 4-O-acetylase-like acetyltransferase